MKHFMILAKSGQAGFKNGHVTKDDDYERTLRAHKESQDEVKSEQRDKASKAVEYDEFLASLFSKLGKKWESFL